MTVVIYVKFVFREREKKYLTLSFLRIECCIVFLFLIFSKELVEFFLSEWLSKKKNIIIIYECVSKNICYYLIIWNLFV